MQTFLFYDIETTGLNKSFDQVLHFAAIRTDIKLQELERYDIKVKLNPDVVPAPHAIITHQISIAESLQGTPELDAIVQIHKCLNTPGTISIGYNTLGFDDEFLRFSFYRNLLTPYTHQYANQCSRLDLYPIAILFYLFKNDVIRWPTKNGQPSLKLEYLNTENQFIQGRSHHAMVDVEVTLALARQFYQAKDMWEYVLGYFSKHTDQERYQQLPDSISSPLNTYREGIMVLGKFGTTDLFHAPVLFLGESNAYKGQGLWLRLDSTTLPLTTENSISENTWVIRKKWGEPGFVLPPKERYLAHFSSERQTHVAANKVWLNQNPDIFKKIVSYYRDYTYPRVPNVDIEASLYLNGFWSAEEMQFCRQFHQATARDKSMMTENMKNPKLQELAVRLLGRHYPDALNENQKQLFADYMQSINPQDENKSIIDFRGEKRLSPRVALSMIAELRGKPDLSSTQITLLDDLAGYLQNQFSD